MKGGTVLFVSSRDEMHPGDNVIDGDDHTFWITTGLFPQEILLQLPEPSQISSVRLATTNVRSMRVEACSEETPVNFKVMSEQHEMNEKSGRMQIIDLACAPQEGPVGYVKLTILNGWHDFVSVHHVHVQ